MRKLKYVIVILAIALLAAACSGNKDKSSTDSEAKVRDDSYNSLVKDEPAHSMTYSPTRKTINAWIDTWNKRGQLSFTYILNQEGTKVGYYVFAGPPVSYCAALTPTWKDHKIDLKDTPNVGVTVPAQSVDGVFYSGGQCVQYYGVDATTGQLIEFTVGGALNYVSATQPIDLETKPLGFTKISDLKQDATGAYVAP